MSYNWNLPLRALLIGGPKHGTKIPIDRHNLRTGYEIIETGDSPDATKWRSHKYVNYAALVGTVHGNDEHLFLHESVGDPETHKLRETVQTARDEIATASQRLASHIESTRNLQSEVEVLRAENKRLKERWEPAQEKIRDAIALLDDAEWTLA